MGILWPHSNTVIRTNADARAAGAKIYFFEAGTTTPRTSYQDAALTTPHTNPVIADAYGRAPAIFLDYGSYRERVRTSGNTTLWDTDGIPNPAPIDPEEDTDPNALFQTGDYLMIGKNNTTRGGFVRCNGRTIGSATSGASERANPDCEGLFTYLYTYDDAQAPVSGGRGANAAADWAANKTIRLPDHRGATMIGFDDMGNSAAGLLGSAPVQNGSGTAAGSIIGANTHTLTTSQMPSHAHSLSSVTAVSNGAHTHSLSGTATSNGAHTHGITDTGHVHSVKYDGLSDSASGAANFQLTNLGPTASTFAQNTQSATTGISIVSDGAHTHPLSGTAQSDGAHTHTLTGSMSSVGSDASHNILARSIPVTVLMKL